MHEVIKRYEIGRLIAVLWRVVGGGIVRCRNLHIASMSDSNNPNSESSISILYFSAPPRLCGEDFRSRRNSKLGDSRGRIQ